MEQFLPLGLQVGAGGVLALMCYQDWQARSISWPAFPVLALLLLAVRLGQEAAGQIALQAAANGGIIMALLAVLALYTRLRLGLHLRECLGSGDVLFWAAAAVYFSPPGFLLFFVGSSVVALATAVWARLRPAPLAEALQIPLAGVQAGCLLGLLAVQNVAPTWARQWPAAGSLTALWP